MNRNLARDRIVESPLLGALEDPAVDALVDAGTIVRIERDRDLFRAGDAYRGSVFIHLDGELEQISGRGDVRRARSGDLVGLANYLDGVDYRSTARARSECLLLEVPDGTVRRLESESPAFLEAIDRALAARMRKARQVRESVRGTLARPARQIMHSPLVSCPPETSLRDALAILARRQIGSLGVIGSDGSLLGLVTPMSISQALVQAGATADEPVHPAACRPAHTATPDTPLWQVEELQQRTRTHYTVVVDERDRPVGMVSQTDLVRSLATPPHTLDDEIAGARDLDTLAALARRLPEAARQARDSHRSTVQAVRALTDTHLAIQHRVIQLVLAELRANGLGDPPARFALIIMGSGGRGEMLLTTDQDNGLIVDDRAGPEDMQWFGRFADALNPALDRVGYMLCPGEIMARNPEFRRTLDGWCRRITRLIDRPGEDSARWSTIVFDFATQYGDDSLTAELRAHLNREIRRGSGLLKMMVRDDADGRPALGLFNRLVTTPHAGAQAIDIKRNGIRIIVDAARVYALAHGISRNATAERLDALARIGALDAEFVDGVRIAFEELQDLLLSHQLRQAARGETPDKFVRPDRLSGNDRERLRIAMRTAKRLQERLQDRFGVDPD